MPNADVGDCVRQTHLELAVFSVDPPALDLLHGLDPETFIIASALADPLVYVDESGAVAPALAVSWRPVDRVTWRFLLREGVRFADGTPLDADDVVATFAEHLDPENRTVAGRTSLGAIKACRKIGPLEVEIETVAPDSMLLRRLSFSLVYSKALLARGGRSAVRENPSACGAYILDRWVKGVEIVLRRNPLRWGQRGSVDTIRIPILRQKNWVEALRDGSIDAAIGIDVHDRARLDGQEGVATYSADAAISHFFLLKHRGPLASLAVRKALNHAVHRQLIVDITEHGHGRPQRSIATPGTFGHAPDVEPYVYDPDLAQRLLADAGYANGFTLRGAVSEGSTAVFQVLKEFLARIGVRLEADVMPRAEWVQTVRGPKLRNEGGYEGDFAFFSTGHPLLHATFHQFIFLFSKGDWSLVSDPDYDRRFIEAATATGPDSEEALRRLERHIVDNAMILFTVQGSVHAAAREGVSFPLPRGGHFNTSFWWNVRSTITRTRERRQVAATETAPEYRALLQATSHLGALYLSPNTTFARPEAARIWDNLAATQQRWEAQLQPILRELVSQAETKTHLANVLDSTERVAIAGVSDDGRLLFVNEGYRQMLGDVHPLVAVESRWKAIRERVDAAGAWASPIRLDVRSGTSANAPTDVYLTVTRARDREQIRTGYTFVLSDFSGAEERIRNGAIRAILDNVPYGLFRCSPDGVVLAGFSAACHALLPGARTRSIEGSHFTELLGADPCLTQHLALVYEQLCEDYLPENVALDQFPRRIEVDGKALGLSAAVLRDDAGVIVAVLFSIFDETERVAAERSQEQLRGAMNVLKHREPFSAFVREVVTASDDLLESFGTSPAWQSLARRFVHTCKGVFAQFGLVALSRRVHELEDAPELDTETLHALRRALRDVLAENEQLWQLRFDDCAPRYALEPSDFRTLDEALAAATTVEEARTLARRWIDGHQQKTVGSLIGPLAASCAQHAERRGKHVRFVLDGPDLGLPSRHWPVVSSLTHAVRNAVDHGIELPSERGEKDPCGEVRVAFSEHAGIIRCRVTDDGRGIDTDALVARARAKGLVDAEATLPRSKALALVFEDGLSSQDGVTETAGRGVGMGAVKTAVEALGGSLTIASEPGRGTTIDLQWPRAA